MLHTFGRACALRLARKKTRQVLRRVGRPEAHELALQGHDFLEQNPVAVAFDLTIGKPRRSGA